MIALRIAATSSFLRLVVHAPLAVMVQPSATAAVSALRGRPGPRLGGVGVSAFFAELCASIHACTSASSNSRVLPPTRRPAGKPRFLIHESRVTRLLTTPSATRSANLSWRLSIVGLPVGKLGYPSIP